MAFQRCDRAAPAHGLETGPPVARGRWPGRRIGGALPRWLRRTGPGVLVAAVAVAGWACDRGATEPEAKGPTAGAAAPATRGDAINVLLVTLDTVRADALGPYGQPLPTSPQIDRLAREGVLFDQAFTAAPNTLPSHATILTGRFPFAHGVRSNAGFVLPDANVTLAEILRERGYVTAAEVAAPVLDAATRLDQGFEQYRDLTSPDVERIRTDMSVAGGESRTVILDERSAADVTRFGKRFLTRNRDRPFFLWLHYFDPHRLYVPRPEFQARLPGEPYLAEVLYVDHSVGEVIRHLEGLGLRERTLVVLVADHGEGLGEHGELSHSFFVYDTTQRVPLILWGPSRLPAGRRIDAVVRTVDIAPTVLDFLGLPAPADVQGVSLLPLVEGLREDLALPAYGESIEIATLFDGSPVRSLRVGDWKYLHQVDPELYHVADDPSERRNLAAEHPEKVAELRERLQSLLAEAPPAPDGAAVALDTTAARQLAQLGYVAAGGGPAQGTDLDSLALRGPAPADVSDDIERYARAMGLANEGFHAEAEPVLAELAARHPESGPIQQAFGRTLASQAKYAEARPVLERAAGLLGCSATASRELAIALGALRDYAAQVSVLTAAVEGCPESYELLNDYAYALATVPDDDLRDAGAALTAARRAAALTGNDDASVLDTLAAAYAEAGDFESAVRTARRAVRLAAEQRTAPEVVAVIRASLERYREGRPTRAQ